MASSGTINAAQLGTRPYLRISWTTLSQDTSNNRSRVRLDLILVSTHTLNFSASKTGSNNGSSFTYTGGFSGTGTQLLNRREIWVSHNSDGTRTQSVYGNFNIQVSWGDGNISSLAVSGNMNLDTIPRASDLNAFSINNDLQPNTSIALGLSLGVKSGNFRHNIYLRDGNTTIQSWLNQTNPSSLTVSSSNVNSLLADMPNNNSRTLTLRVQTISGNNGSNIGSAVTRNAVVRVHENVLPTASNIRTLISGNGRDDEINMYVQGHTRVYSDFDRSAAGGANISSSRIIIRKQSNNSDRQEISGRQGTTNNYVSGHGIYEAIGIVRDTRGRENQVTTTFTVHEYNPPEIEDFFVSRKRESQALVEVGRYGRHSRLNGNNPLTVVVQSRVFESGSSWSNVSGAGLTNYIGTGFGSIISPTTQFDVMQSYQFRMILTDSFNRSIDSITSIPTQKVLLDIHENKGIGIGKLHEDGDLDVAGEAYFNGNMYFLSGIISRLNASLYSASDGPNELPQGFSYFDSAFADGFPNDLGAVFNFFVNSTRNIQLFSSHSTGELLYRQYHFASNNGWGPWYDAGGNTQGSNSNGQWLRFRNGWQICFLERQGVVISSISSGQSTQTFQWDFPRPFLEESTNAGYNFPVHVSITGALYTNGVSSQRRTTTRISSGDFSGNYLRGQKVEFDFLLDGVSATRLQYTAYAIGRWK